jgi:hypothetical protein
MVASPLILPVSPLHLPCCIDFNEKGVVLRRYICSKISEVSKKKRPLSIFQPSANKGNATLKTVSVSLMSMGVNVKDV